MYLKEGDYAVVEEPAVPAVVNIFLHTGAQVLLVPMERDGMKIEALESLVERYHPKLIYTLPNFKSHGSGDESDETPPAVKSAYSRKHPPWWRTILSEISTTMGFGCQVCIPWTGPAR